MVYMLRYSGPLFPLVGFGERERYCLGGRQSKAADGKAGKHFDYLFSDHMVPSWMDAGWMEIESRINL